MKFETPDFLYCVSYLKKNMNEFSLDWACIKVVLLLFKAEVPQNESILRSQWAMVEKPSMLSRQQIISEMVLISICDPKTVRITLLLQSFRYLKKSVSLSTNTLKFDCSAIFA